MVWRKTLPTTRTIKLRLEKIQQDCGSQESLRLDSPCALPIALSVCKESRLEAKRYYKLAFSTTYHEGRIYIDFSCDVVYMACKSTYVGQQLHISPEKLKMLLNRDEINKVERMAVSSIYAETVQGLLHFQSFEGLKDLSIEFESRDEDEMEAFGNSTRQITLVEEEELRMMSGQPLLGGMDLLDIDALDRAFVLETFHEVRMACPKWRAPGLRFVKSGVGV